MKIQSCARWAGALSYSVAIQAGSALAQAPVPGGPPAPPTVIGTLMSMMPMILTVVLIFYVLVLRPQQTRMEAQDTLLKGLAKGDMVVTSGGLIGKVAALEDDVVQLEVSSGARIRVEKSHISKRYEKPAQA